MTSRDIKILSVILVLTVLVFWPSLKNGWVNWDDSIHILDNPSVILDGNVFTRLVNKTYIPLTELSFSLEHHWIKFKAFFYHADNLLLYLADIVLVFFCARRFGLSFFAAGFGALIFSVHPLHVESVAWITERKDLLYALFYLAAIYCYLGYIQRKDRSLYLLTLLWGLLSILSKPMAISLPLIFFFCDWMFRRPLNRALVLEKIPPIFMMGTFGAVTYLANARMVHAFSLESVLTWAWCFVFYIRKFFIPIHLFPIYWLPKPVSLLNLEYAFSVIAFIGIGWSLLRFQKNRWYVGAWTFYFLSLFFIFRFDDLGDINIVADRFMFLPCLGFCLFLGVEADNIRQKIKEPQRVGFYICVAAALLFLSIQTYRQCQIWQGSLSMWTYTLGSLPKEVKQYPNAAMVYTNTGAAYKHKKDFPSAAFYFAKAFEVNPHYMAAVQGYYDIGTTELNNNHLDWAIMYLDKALEANPQMAEAYHNRGVAYQKKGNLDQALMDYGKTIELSPQFGGAYYNVAVLYYLKGDYASARENAEKAQLLGSSVEEKFLKDLQNAAHQK